MPECTLITDWYKLSVLTYVDAPGTGCASDVRSTCTAIHIRSDSQSPDHLAEHSAQQASCVITRRKL